MSIQSDIATWARETFPDADLDKTLDKFGDEVEELYEFLERGDEDDSNYPDEAVVELADVAILLYQIADRCGVDLDMAVVTKLEANRTRTWTRQPDNTYQHVEGE